MPHLPTASTPAHSSTSAAARSISSAWNALERAGAAGSRACPSRSRSCSRTCCATRTAVRVDRADIEALARWTRRRAGRAGDRLHARRACCCRTSPACPCVVDLAAMRDAIEELGGDPEADQPAAAGRARHRPLGAGRPVRHRAHALRAQRANSSSSATASAMRFLRWGQQAFDNFRVVPPDTGIVHQVNLEYLGRVVFRRAATARRSRIPTRSSAPTRTRR